MNIIIAILYLINPPYAPKKPQIHLCDRDMSHLPLNYQIEMAIGCSTVNNIRVYPQFQLERLYIKAINE